MQHDADFYTCILTTPRHLIDSIIIPYCMKNKSNRGMFQLFPDELPPRATFSNKIQPEGMSTGL